MTDINVRDYVVDAIRPLLPEDWEVLPYGRTYANLDHVAVLFTMKRISRLEAAPQSRNRTYTITLTVLEPNQDAAQAYGPLDDALVNLTNAIDDIGPSIGLKWTSAEAGQGNPAGADGRPLNYGFDIDLELTYHRKDNSDG